MEDDRSNQHSGIMNVTDYWGEKKMVVGGDMLASFPERERDNSVNDTRLNGSRDYRERWEFAAFAHPMDTHMCARTDTKTAEIL